MEEESLAQAWRGKIGEKRFPQFPLGRMDRKLAVMAALSPQQRSLDNYAAVAEWPGDDQDDASTQG